MKNYPRNQHLRELLPYSKIQRSMKLSLIMLFTSFGLASATETYNESATSSINIENKTVQTDSQSTQDKKIRITGTIMDEAGLSVIGANILVKGVAGYGAITDSDGSFELEVSENATLLITSIGYVTQEITITNKTQLNIILKEDSIALDELVVVGYSTQAKKDITGSVSVVDADDLKESHASTFAEALQGKAPGVYISTTGAPGSPTTIRIRGVGSVNGSDPLVIVDGVSGVDIDAVNPNNIESFQILKDASATAIYGAQGANGVIIITTKQGSRTGKVQVSYNAYVGMSKMANSGFDVLNAWDAMEFQAEGLVNRRDVRGVTTGLVHSQFGSLNASDQLTMPYAIKPGGMSKEAIISQFGSIEKWEASYVDDGTNSWSRSAYYQMLEDGYSEAEARAGTDWYDLVTQTGFIQNHQISVTGGGDKGMYSMGVGYTSNEGTVKSSYFDRYSLSANATFEPNKYFTIGQNTNLSLIEFAGDRGGQGDNSVFGKIYSIQPWVPMYNIGGDFAGSQAPEGGRTVSAYNDVISTKDNWSRYLKLQNSVFAQLTPIKGLTIKTQFSTRIGIYWRNEFIHKNIMANKEGSSNNSFEESSSWRFDYQWTNTANYTRSFGDHNMAIVAGTEALMENMGREMNARRIDYIFENDPNTWTLNNGSSSNLSNGGAMKRKTTMFGLFARGDYSYKGKYLVTLTVRRDASSKFGSNNRWGTFPSASVGWRLSDENFMKKSQNWLDDLKVRVGYGTTGNSNIGEYNYAFQYGTGNGYLYGIAGDDANASTGYGISNLGDPNAKWETTTMLNVGLDGALFKNRLSFAVDYYIKKTSDMLVAANWSALAGSATKPKVNIGDMENRGVDFSIGWSDNVGKVGYNINVNLSQYKNKVISLGSSDIFHDTRLSKTNITTPGQAVGMFYGYNIVGIYQDEADVLGYENSNGGAVLPFAVTAAKDLDPKSWIGRYKIEDVNNDGKIGADDQTIIGNPHPDLTGGINLGVNYRGWDLNTYLYFSVGNDLYRHYMHHTHFGSLQSNYSYDRRDNSWHPTNPDGIYPLWAGSAGEGTEAASQSSSIYIQDGSYLRMQNLSLGYSLPTRVLEKIGFTKIRFYLQASNLFTITGYDGLDPEVRSSTDLNKGIDYGAYGMPRQFTFGVNIIF